MFLRHDLTSGSFVSLTKCKHQKAKNVFILSERSYV